MFQSRLFVLILIFTLTFPVLMMSQISTNERPFSEVSYYAKTAAQNDRNIPVEVMPSINLTQLQTEDAADEVNGVPPRFGKDFDVDFNLNNSGYWETLPNGDRLWRLTLRASGAKSINLAYDDFWIPIGAKLFIYNQDKSHVIGAFTNLNNKESRKMGTGLVFGDEVTVEYYEPADVEGLGAIDIAKVVHGYRMITLPEEYSRGFGDAGSCTVNVVCDEGDNWRDELKGVAMMLLGSTRWCSGSLITTSAQDCTPYFLTANHCVNGLDAVSNPDASNFSFYWRYESPDCGYNVSDGPTNMSTSGATLVASSQVASGGTNSTGSDFALFLLTENPVTAGYDVYFNGWDKRGPTSVPAYFPSTCNGIHHPSGDVKKISTDTNGAIQGGGSWTEYWELFWEATTNGHSVTEGGSSGSPLFDSNTKRIIGQLYGGSSINCSNPASDLGRYGGIFYSFENVDEPQINARQLAPWLDPGQTGALFIDGRYPCTEPLVSVRTSSGTASEGTSCDNRTVTLEARISPAATSDTQVTFSIGGTANANDYSLSSNSITFPSGSTANQSILIEINQDAAIEADETIILTIASVTGSNATASSNNSYTLTLTNDDAAPTTDGVVFNADFEAGANGFTSTNVEGGTGGFSLGNTANTVSTYWSVAGTNDSQFAFINEDACNCNSNNVRFVSSAVDLSGYTGNISMTYDHAFANNGETANVIVSTDGTSFTNVAAITNTTSGTNTPWVNNNTVDLSSYAGQNSVFVGFTYSDLGSWAYGIAIDNVKITATGGARAQSSISSSLPVELGANETVHFYDVTSNKIMATIENLSSHDYGCTTVEVNRAGVSAENTWEAGKTMTSKTLKVLPQTNNPNGSYNITLYYNEDEVAGWENADASTDTRNDLLLVKTPDNISNGDAANYETQATTMGALGDINTFTASFASGFSGFALGNVTPPALLPVTLTDFTATAQQDFIALKWETEQEFNNKGFNLQRSTSGYNFENITWISGRGNESEGATNYTFNDTEVRKNVTYYYRLQQVDFDAKESFSAIEVAKLKSIIEVEVMPNPVRDNLLVDLTAETYLDGQIQIIDVYGRVIFESNLQIEEHLQLPIDVTKFAPGVYWLQVRKDAELLHVEKIIKR